MKISYHISNLRPPSILPPPPSLPSLTPTPSPSTPVTAGTALLVRQYFMDPQFWATLCQNKDHSSCSAGAITPSGYLLKVCYQLYQHILASYTNTTTHHYVCHFFRPCFYTPFNQSPLTPFLFYSNTL